MIKRSDAARLSSPQASLDALCGNLIDGMHAASQPLTILRASLGTAAVFKQSPEDMRKLLRQSAKEVERLCVLFSYLQQFVVVESTRAEPAAEDLAALVNHAVEGVDVLFNNAGISLLRKQREETAPSVCVDSSRLEHALSSILLVVLGRAQQGGEVTVTTHASGVSIEIAANAANANETILGAETRLSMALAAANLRSQGGTMTWEHAPFTVHITLPTADMPPSE